jgi:hypothetical protein
MVGTGPMEYDNTSKQNEETKMYSTVQYSNVPV